MGLFSGIGKALGGIFATSTTTSSKAASKSTTAGEQTDLPPELLASLRSLFQNTVGGDAGAAVQSAGVNRLNSLNGFNPEQFANDVSNQAAVEAGLNLESSVNDVLSRAGGGNGSSQAALITNRLRNNTAATLAGTRAAARATGEQIATQGIGQASGDLNQLLATIIQGTRGSSVSGKLTEDATQTGKATSKNNPGLGGFFKGLASISAGLGGAQ